MLRNILRRHWTALAAWRHSRLALSTTQALLALGILGLLAYSLNGVAWSTLRTELPVNPLFYLLFALFYVWLPLSEMVAYRVIWPLHAWKSLPIFIKKRIYNREIFQYSGEVFFFTWARRQVDRPSRDIARDIRDQNIVSSAASTLVALILVVAFLSLSRTSLTAWVGPRGMPLLIAGTIVSLGLVAVGIRFRRHIFAMAPGTALVMFGVHAARFALEQSVQIAMWAVALPEVPLRVWCTYAALSLVISRLPLVTNRDLLFASIGITLAAGMAIPVEQVAALMLVVAGLGKVATILLFAGSTLASWCAPTWRSNREGLHLRIPTREIGALAPGSTCGGTVEVT